MHRTPDQRDTERVLIYGPPGSGKSSAARALVEDGQRVIIIDTEGAYRRMLKGLDLDNVTIHDLQDEVAARGSDEHEVILELLTEAIDEIHEEDDPLAAWLVIDSFTPTWEWCQASYISRVHGDDDVNYFLARRAEMERAQKMGNPLDGNHDWTYINKMYAQLYNRLLRWPGHALITAEGVQLDDRDGREVQKDYGHVGWKPRGQKRLGHIPSTVLLSSRRAGGRWVYDTVKDRERDELTGVEVDREVGGFVGVYLVNIAGWEDTQNADADVDADAGDGDVVDLVAAARARALGKG